MSDSPRGAAQALLSSVEADLEELVAISTPSGDLPGTERALGLCEARMPPDAELERLPCSSDGHAPDLLARLPGLGSGRILLLGHLDTVVAHSEHIPLTRAGNTWRGSGTVDMKGGVAVALGLTRWLAEHRGLFAELAVLLVVDEEWRLQPFSHLARFSEFDACLCFEAGERTSAGEEVVIVERKAAGTLRVTARGRAAHAGSNPDAGANALLALAETAIGAASMHGPSGEMGLSVVPSRIQSGGAINVVPADGELMIDMRAHSDSSFGSVIEGLPRSSHGAAIDATLIRSWPGMDSREATTSVLTAAASVLGRGIIGGARGGASDASHFAGAIPITIDGLGPRGGHAHNPDEFVHAPSIGERIEVAAALCEALSRSDKTQ